MAVLEIAIFDVTVLLFHLIQGFCESYKVLVSILNKYIHIYKFGVKSFNY